MWSLRSDIRYANRSPKWSKVRRLHLDKEPCCRACGSCLKPEVHHIVPVHIDESKELDLDNLITLCDKYCHFIFGHLMDWKSWNVNVVKDTTIYFNSISTRPKILLPQNKISQSYIEKIINYVLQS